MLQVTAINIGEIFSSHVHFTALVTLRSGQHPIVQSFKQQHERLMALKWKNMATKTSVLSRKLGKNFS